MLEVKNLRKVYKSKNGVNVNALDGVSLQFPQTGMVFLLGKSGSGKSTLLNVCGGLDAPTEGEIIVKGRSSKDFSQSDFDSYRNTFVGFIFQEYNILNEFTVEDNIALALELQGKSKDKAAIQKLLEDVDLTGFAKRKPNTLSGGQKQRIAIARALIKSPDIIMADEPTGALDSNTGKQVFDTLKKLSRNKLVLVVSHDRDFAEQYGDRIIELMDGKVISDVSKTQISQQTLSANVNTLGEVLCIKKGTTLTQEDFASIKSFLEQAQEDVIIAKSPKDVENFKRVSRIDGDGRKEVFKDTASNISQKTYTKEDSKFIRSKLPMRHAIKIGASGLKSKPVRLFFTILLCTVAFVMFGLLSTLNFYDSEATFRQTMADTQLPVVKLQKQYKGTETWYNNGEEEFTYETWFSTKFTPQERQEFADKLSKDTFGAVMSYGSFNLRQVENKYWVNEIAAFAYLPEDNLLRNSVIGKYPENKNEIVLSRYFGEMLIACNAYDSNGKALDVNDTNALVGKEFTINGTTYTVTGILDNGAVDEKYAELKSNTENGSVLERTFRSYLADSLHQVVFVNAECLEILSASNQENWNRIFNYTYAVIATEHNGELEFPEWSNGNYITLENAGKLGGVFSFAEDKTQPGDNEAMISLYQFDTILREHCYQMADQMNQQEDYAAAEVYYAISDKIGTIEGGGKYVYSEENDKDEFIPITQAERENLLKELVDFAKKENINFQIGLKRFDMNNQTAIGEAIQLQAVAVYLPATSASRTDWVIVSDNTFNTLWDEHKLTMSYSEVKTAYKTAPDEIYTTLYVPYVYSEQVADTYWAMYNNQEFGADDSRVRLASDFLYSLQMVDETVKSLSKVFLYVGLVMAVFAALLLSNFISVSISQKKRDIGILRAVGARSTDVFKIFFSESFVIAAICVGLSIAASIGVCGYLNKELASQLGAALFVFGPISLLILVGIALLTAVVATFLPVHNAAKKKPVESIRAL